MQEMFERLLIDQLDLVLNAIIASDDDALSGIDPGVLDLALVAIDLRRLPAPHFQARLKEALRRKTMSAEAQTAPEEKANAVAQGSLTPYLTVERAEDLVEFVKQAFSATETFRTIGSAGGLHAEVTIGDSRLMIGGYLGVEEKPT